MHRLEIHRIEIHRIEANQIKMKVQVHNLQNMYPAVSLKNAEHLKNTAAQNVTPAETKRITHTHEVIKSVLFYKTCETQKRSIRKTRETLVNDII
jgi:hypothetical protein